MDERSLLAHRRAFAGMLLTIGGLLIALPVIATAAKIGWEPDLLYLLVVPGAAAFIRGTRRLGEVNAELRALAARDAVLPRARVVR